MLTVTYDNLISILALFTALCVAGGWLIKIIKGIKRPADEVNEKLERDYEKIEELEEQQDYNSKAIKLLMRSEMAILGHLQSGNCTGEMAKIEKDIKEFLLNN